jgi:hypothetical protein
VPRPPSPATVRPISAEAYSLRVTVDAGFKKELDELKGLLAHKIPGGDLSAVLREGVRCAIEKHGKRKGAVEPARTRKAPPTKGAARTQPGLELDHVVPAALGGKAPSRTFEFAVRRMTSSTPSRSSDALTCTSSGTAGPAGCMNYRWSRGRFSGWPPTPRG